MGRRIPKSSRHKKLKSVDPFRKDRAIVKEDRRANRPPKSLEQEVPQSFTTLFGDQQKQSRRPQRRKKKSKDLIEVKRCKGEGEQRGMTRPLKVLPETLTQERYETDEQFLGRIDRHAGRAFGEARIEEKFDVHIHEDETGRATVDPRGGRGEGVSEYGARKREKRRAREKKLREKKKQKWATLERDFSHLRDEVAFGEVADRPPDIGPRQARSGNPKKELSACDRRKLETERQRVVLLYRQMKAKAALKGP